MRALEFRAWYKYANGSGFMINNFQLKDVFQDVITKAEDIDWYDYIIEQYTGLTDKGGEKIFEGDVVNVEYNYIGKKEVKFENGAYNIHNYNIKKCSICGNIHTNKET